VGESKVENAASFLEPFPGRCIVKRDESTTKAGLIYIPEKHRQVPTTGVVLAVGDEDRAGLIGRRIAWGRYSGVPLYFTGDRKFDVLTYDEIIAFVNDPNITIDHEDISSLTRSE
jgi:co-chaperonin GroES (HSP10)